VACLHVSSASKGIPQEKEKKMGFIIFCSASRRRSFERSGTSTPAMILVVAADGSEHNIELPLDFTLADLRGRIAQLVGCPEHEQILYRNETGQDDDQGSARLNRNSELKDGSTVYLVIDTAAKEGGAVLELTLECKCYEDKIEECECLQNLGLPSDYVSKLSEGRPRKSEPDPRPLEGGAATFKLTGGEKHASLINGEYLEDRSWPRPHLVFSNGELFMWNLESAGRWCIGRQRNVGTAKCRAYVQSEACNPECIPLDAAWMVHDGSTEEAYAPMKQLQLKTVNTRGQPFKQPLHALAPPSLCETALVVDGVVAAKLSADWSVAPPAYLLVYYITPHAL
jgi:hypothetical protein